MNKVNGKSEAKNAGLDLDHELPAGDGDEATSEARSGDSSVSESGIAEVEGRARLTARPAGADAGGVRKCPHAEPEEQQEFRDYAVADAIKSLLPVMDSLERALQVKSDAAELRNGVELIYKQLQAALAKLSVHPIVAKGEPFDPRYHEAIEMVETSEAPDHQVIEELQRGYKFKDRLLRPAMVKVASNHGK